MLGGSSKFSPKTSNGRRHPAYFPYLYSVIGLGLASISWAAYRLPSMGIGYKWLILAGLTLISSSLTIRIPATNSKISIGDTFFFTNIVLFGTPAGILTAAVDALVSSVRSQNRSRRLQYSLFNVSAIACSAHLCGAIFFSAIHRGPLSRGSLPSPVSMMIPLAALAFVHYLGNSGSVAIIIALEKHRSIATIWKESFLWTSITYFAGAAAAGFISLTIGSITPQIIGVALPVILAIYFTYKTYLDKVQQVCSLAYYDSLTNLPNRILFKDHLNQALALAQRKSDTLAVMFLDLDNFKRINDSYGHSVGDSLLKNVAGRLSETLHARQRDILYHADSNDVMIGRFGGDEFTIMISGVHTPENIAQVAQHLLEAFATPFVLDGHELSAAVSIGISLSPMDGTSSDALLKNADAAMFCAKESGKSGYRFYSHMMNDASIQKLQLENELRKAHARNEFLLYYQPKVDSVKRTIIGAEALIRWQHPSRGLLTAAQFIGVAEETGLIRPIGEWVLRTACDQVAAWQKSGLPVVPVAVNLSSVQFRQQNLQKLVAKVLCETAVDPKYIELEITESMIMQNETEADNALRELRNLGCRISIDDFGTGYSSLSRLKQFSLDALKVDRSFVKDLANSPNDMAITKAIIAMAHSLELKVIAEGVETEQQYQFLKDQGCDEIQGYLFGKPTSRDEFATLLANQRDAQTLSRPNDFGSATSGASSGGRRIARRHRNLRLVSSRAVSTLHKGKSEEKLPPPASISIC